MKLYLRFASIALMISSNVVRFQLHSDRNACKFSTSKE